MNEEQLREELRGLLGERNEVGIVVYALLKGNANEPRKLDIDNDDLKALAGVFLDSIESEMLGSDEWSVLLLSSADERTNAIYEYDLDKIPEEMVSMQSVSEQDNIDVFDFTDESLRNVRALIIEIGNNDHQVVLYKNMAPVNVFGRSSFFLKKHDRRFAKIDDEFVRISSGFQVMGVNGSLLIMDLPSLERLFGFDVLIKKEAETGLAAIDDLGLIENIEAIAELTDEVRYARKLTRISKSSPVIEAGVSNESIIGFCKTFPALAGKIRFNDVKDKILLDTKKSKDLLIKLLMDDFLTSELTSFHYTSLAKDKT